MNGEAIYATRPWKVYKEGEDVRYTRSKDGKHVYAISLQWPGRRLALKNVLPRQGSEVFLLGVREPLASALERATRAGDRNPGQTPSRGKSPVPAGLRVQDPGVVTLRRAGLSIQGTKGNQMSLEKVQIPSQRPIYPTPAGLVTTVDGEGNPNIITLARSTI